MKLGKILKIAGIAFAGYAFGVWTAGYHIARDDNTKKAAEGFADAWDQFKSLAKGGESKPTEEVAEAAEEVAEAVEEAASEVVPDIEVATNDSEEESDQPED